MTTKIVGLTILTACMFWIGYIAGYCEGGKDHDDT